MCRYSTATTPLLLIGLMLVALVVEAAAAADRDVWTTGSKSSRWLKTVSRQTIRGCGFQPWVCNQAETPPYTMRCCGNRCVNVTSDPNHCGFCLIRCPFTRQCCGGLCVNTNFNPFHCGRCFHFCGLGIPCIFGLCGYSMPDPATPSASFPPALSNSSTTSTII
uniref:Stigma-specific STIG1-like protein 4 n=1 Tax=Nelumbo nucifera TaxID=4432 RepID=A0A822ZGU5_NELNU|nr:TPA_asm: hypothetical protein HUJ06_001111 [Nelumbo nucifera]